jgi:SAM-dependent methyltransferase
MDLDTFNWLLSAEGQALLAVAADGDLSAAARLRELERLRRLATPERAAAVYETALLRQRAAAKFSRADAMYFTREALEQSSGELIAAYRARRYVAWRTVADLCCGVGGDTLALAGAGQVVAVDRDRLRLAMAAANAHALGIADRISFVEADLEQVPPPHTEAIFFDPARREDGRRVFALADYRPPVALVRVWREHTPAIGVKTAPGVGDEELAVLAVPEVEFISVDGELKEAALWFGPMAGEGRRATVLRTEDQRPRTKDQGPKTKDERPKTNDQGQELTNRISGTSHTARDSHGIAARYDTLLERPVLRAPLAEPLAFLYEPDPAVIRARAVATLAERIGAAQIDPEIAYLTADQAVGTPFARCWRVLEWQPFGLKRLRARLRALDAGAVTVKKRGSPLDTDALARRLSGDGTRPLVVVLTQVAGRPAALICEGPVVGAG